jgi:SAM-dependent methyltransferase
MASEATGDFTVQAAWYDQARPGYPTAFVDRLLRRVDGGSWNAGDAVIDLGAGTGLFTRRLLGRGLQVTALEPGAAMRAAAPPLPDVVWLPGTFEATGAPDGAFRMAFAAQSFHWADPPRALPELRRILRPRGRLTLLWNDRRIADSLFLQQVQAAIRTFAPDFDEAYRDVPWHAIGASTGDFTFVGYDEQPHVIEMSRERCVNLWRSHHRATMAVGERRLPELLAEIARLAALQPEPLPIPYMCRAWTFEVCRPGERAASVP